MGLKEKIYFSLSSKNNLIYILSREEQIALNNILEYCQGKTETIIFRPSTGFCVPECEIHKDNIADIFVDWADKNYINGKTLILIDFHKYLNDIRMVSAIKYIIDSNQKCQIVILSSILSLPEELAHYTTLCEANYLSENEIINLIRNNFNQKDDLIKFLIKAPKLTCSSLSSHQILCCINEALADSNDYEKQRKYFFSKKNSIIKSDAKLEIIDTSDFKEDNIGGYGALKKWIKELPDLTKKEDNNLMPKGMLLVGVPGCGKSLSIKITAKLKGFPLLRLDFGQLMDKYVGNTEKNLIKAIKVAEQMAPCVLWFDEFEKSFGNSNNSDSNISQRLLAYILTWMQENKSNVFVAATVNNIAKLPPELLRRGRFDKIYFVDFPDISERQEILKILLSKYKLEISEEKITTIAEKLPNYSGADIEYIIKEIRREHNEENLTEDSILRYFIEKIEFTPSINKTMYDDIRKMRDEFTKREFENFWDKIYKIPKKFIRKNE